MTKSSPQVKKEIGYNFLRYGGVGRFSSYAYQISEILHTNPVKVLEIGIGDATVGSYIKKNTNIDYLSLDIAIDLEPNIVGDLKRLPFLDNTFDTVCAFEVLEHLPFDTFEDAIKELIRVSKKNLLISLPHFGPSLLIDFKIPFIKRFRLALKFPYHPKHFFNGEHYWEIGKKDYPSSLILKIFQKHSQVDRDFVPFENQYYHFYVLSKINK